MRPWLLDLGCCRGGASMGYYRAGFDVTGVDKEPQPGYPFEFIQADMLDVLAHWDLTPYAAIHASPPCQHHANVTGWRGSRDDHPDVLTPALALLGRISIPWVVENVPEALPTWDYLLCGSQFGLTFNGRTIKRHRGFRFGNWSSSAMLPPCDHRNVLPFMHKGERAYADAMGCTWMSKEAARQAIPPAYTEHIGRELIAALVPAKPPAGCQT